MADEVSLDTLHAWLVRFHELIAENRAYLTELDSAIGDADHGSNLDRGMSAVVSALNEKPSVTIDDLFKRTGMTLVSTVGGASGPLYGTFFLRVGTTAGLVASLDTAALGAALRAGLAGVVQRGKAEVGEKTMLDALTPALAAWDAVAGGDATAGGADDVAGGAGAADGDAAAAAHAAAVAAAAGRDATEPLVAHKGRASYLAERSAGHLDPGAASTALLFQALDEVLARS